MGLPEAGEDELVFGQADVEVVASLNFLVESGVIGDDEVLRLARLMGASFSRLVEAQLEVIDRLLSAETNPVSETASDTEIVRVVESTMLYVWRRHLLAAMGRRLSVDNTDGEFAVGFADLSGFTSLSRTMSGAQLTEMVEAFEQVAFDVVTKGQGRVIKLIGDEVMYVAATVDQAVEIAIGLIRELDHVGNMPALHCGISFGPTIAVGGDVFGPTVNLASRLTKLARAGTVVVPREGASHLVHRDDLVVRRMRRPEELRGAGRPSLLSVRPS